LIQLLINETNKRLSYHKSAADYTEGKVNELSSVGHMHCFEIFALTKTTVTLKSGFGVVQGHWK